jgi:ABC-type lipoprotein export system ATPase subunit
MDILLQYIVPVPLKDRFANRHSDLWNKNIKLNKGDFTKIQAPSGSGKTTFIHLLYNIRQDYTGDILFGEVNLKTFTGNALAEMRQKHISIIFQDLRLFPQLTARDNIELVRVMQPIYESKAIEEMAKRLGVDHILNQQTAICSYGEQQRIAIIRALVQPFSWLLMDEPFSHLDQANTQKAVALIDEECKKRNAGFVLTDLDDDNRFQYSRKLLL